MSDAEMQSVPEASSTPVRVPLTRTGVMQMFESLIRSEVKSMKKKKSPLVYWHKANFSLNLLDTIEEFKQQEQMFIKRGLTRRKNNIGEPTRQIDVDGIRYNLKWYVFSPAENQHQGSEIAEIDRAPCPLYLFVGNVILPGYSYVQVFEEGPVPSAERDTATETAQKMGDTSIQREDSITDTTS